MADDYKEQAPRLARFSAAFSVKDLLKEQDQEEKKKEAIRQQAPVMTEDDDMLIDDEELARLGGLSDMGGGMGADLDLNDNDDIEKLNAKIKSVSAISLLGRGDSCSQAYHEALWMLCSSSLNETKKTVSWIWTTRTSLTGEDSAQSLLWRLVNVACRSFTEGEVRFRILVLMTIVCESWL